MANYIRMERKKSLISNFISQQAVKGRSYSIFIFIVALLSAFLFGPSLALGMDKIAVLPFRINSLEPEESLKTDLQKMFSQDMSKKGYEVISNELINSRLGENLSEPPREEDIILLGKAVGADWIVIGAFLRKDDSINLNVKVMDPDSAKTPFSVMMIENDKKDLPAALCSIADSLASQIKENILVSKIIFKGNKRVSDDAILNIIETQKGDKLDQEKLDRDLRLIYRMGFFDDVGIELSDNPDGKIVTFNVVEKPTIVKITFIGNNTKKATKLLEELGLKLYEVLNRNEVRQSINRLLEAYKTDGYYNVDIKYNVKELPDNEVVLTYVIEEGEKVYIEKIQFVGNSVFDEGDLQDIMLTKEKNWLTWFTSSGVLDKKKLEYDLGRIGQYYDSHGYINARVSAPEIAYDEKEEGLIITISIEEGTQFLVNDVIFEGDLLVSTDVLQKALDIKKDDPFSSVKIYTNTDKIKDIYSDMGYAYTEVDFIAKYVPDSNYANAVVTIEKNKRVRIERINFFGNEITKDKVLRRELKLAEGDYFSSSKLARSRQNLERISIFENHDVKTRRGSSDDKMIIDIEGEEQLQRSVSFSAGYGGYEKFQISMQYENSNLGGRNQNFALNALLGKKTTRFDISLTEPWMFDKPVRGLISLYNWDIDYDEFERERMGGKAGLAFLLGLDDYTRGTVQYAYDQSTVTDVNINASKFIKSMEGDYTTSSVTLGVERNSKNRIWDTSSGSLTYATFEYAGGPLGGNVAFNKYVAGHTFYIPAIWNTVLVVSTEVGFVQGRSGGELPLYEKFLLGGIDTVRGFDYGTISPLDPDTRDEIGGDRMWLYKVEYRFPLVKGEGMTGLVFFDAGNSFDREESWKKGAGTSVGFGIRWRSPMGPLRLEYGYKLNTVENDRGGGKFEFKIGGSF